MIVAFTLAGARGGYRGTVLPADGSVRLEPWGTVPYHRWYRSIGACYEALCGRRSGFVWQTVEQVEANAATPAALAADGNRGAAPVAAVPPASACIR